jgi:ribonucleoside-triphosphate reductase (thioredoxin)
VAVEAIWGAKRADELVEGASELTLTQHLAFQQLYQELWADNAVSYTANINQMYDRQQLADTLVKFGGRLKGATVFPETSMAMAPYEAITKEQYEASLVKDISDGVDEACANGACPIR